jgi:cell wall-associated NlpC family hydrolase
MASSVAGSAITGQQVVDKALLYLGSHYKFGRSGEIPAISPYTYWKVGQAEPDSDCPGESTCLCNDLWADGHYAYQNDCVSWGVSSCAGKRHFDCSSFVWFVFHELDPNFFAGSNPAINEAYHNVGRFITFSDGKGWLHEDTNWENLKPGDWVFFKNCGSGQYQHMGIFQMRDETKPVGDLSRYKIVICDGNYACIVIDNAKNNHDTSDPKSYYYTNGWKPLEPGVCERTLFNYRCITCSDQFQNKCVYPAAYASLTPPPAPTALTCTAPTCSCDGPAAITATLTSGGTALPGKTVLFFLDGSTVGIPGDYPTDAGGTTSAGLGSFRALKPGAHSFVAKFAGDGSYLPSDSPGCTFNAPAETRITCSVNPSEIECGQSVTITAVLTKESDTNVYDPFANADVLFTITKADGSSSTTRTVKTNGSGSAATMLTPATAAVYNVAVAYAGSPGECICASDSTCSFRVWATAILSKFSDCNMSGTKDPGEPALTGWPLRLFRVEPGCSLTEMTDKETLPDGSIKFKKLEDAQYQAIEGGPGLAWERFTVSCPGAPSYCDLRASWAGSRWQFTGATLDGSLQSFNTCTGAPCIDDKTPSVGPFHLSCTASVAFGNVPLGTVTAFKFHDLNMNGIYEPNGEPYIDKDGNGAWTPGEQFTDLNCNGTWDQGEFFVDANKNGVRDLGDPFTDLDGDQTYDYPECPVQGWPFALDGTRRDGRPICPKGISDASGTYVFRDIPPAASSYTLSEDAKWSTVILPTGAVYRTTQPAHVVCSTCDPLGIISRWESTTIREPSHGPLPTQDQFPLDCGASYSSSFGNVCLTTVDGVKEVYLNGMPGQSSKEADASGWHIVLAGKDVKGRDVVPSLSIDTSGGPSVLVPMASRVPIATPCLSPKWYELTTPTDGSFHFLDLPPGHYHLTEQPDHPGLRLDMDKPMMSGFDVRCCPVQTVMRNIADVTWNIYQVYCGDSCGDPAVQQIFGGFKGGFGDPITAVPGVLAFDPGPGWQNYVRATELCREARITNVSLRKFFEGNDVCPDYFKHVDLRQQGSTRIRDWWPLMYEPPTTSWTLSVYYDTAFPVQFPGETVAGVHHQDSWKWTVVTDIEHTKLFIDMIHELPVGSAQKPILSDEALFKSLKAQLDEIDALVKANKTGEAGMKLDTFILDVEDACITEPCVGSQFGTGIANTAENPACCKLILDAEYIGKKLGLWHP